MCLRLRDGMTTIIERFNRPLAQLAYWWLRERLQESGQIRTALRRATLQIDVSSTSTICYDWSHEPGSSVRNHRTPAARRVGDARGDAAAYKTSCPALLGSVVLLRILPERGEESYGRSQNGFRDLERLLG